MKELLKLMENNKNISLNICAGITTFHPTEDDTENIKKLSKWFNKIYIYMIIHLIVIYVFLKKIFKL